MTSSIQNVGSETTFATIRPYTTQFEFPFSRTPRIGTLSFNNFVTSFLNFFQKKTRYVGFFLILLSFWPQVFLGSPEKLPEVQEVPEEQPYNIRELPEDPKFPSCDKDRLSVGGKVGVEARKMTTVTHLLVAIGQVVPGCAWLCQ